MKLPRNASDAECGEGILGENCTSWFSHFVEHLACRLSVQTFDDSPFDQNNWPATQLQIWDEKVCRTFWQMKPWMYHVWTLSSPISGIFARFCPSVGMQSLYNEGDWILLGQDIGAVGLNPLSEMASRLLPSDAKSKRGTVGLWPWYRCIGNGFL